MLNNHKKDLQSCEESLCLDELRQSPSICMIIDLLLFVIMSLRDEIQQYTAKRASSAPSLDGKLIGPWLEVPFTEPFIDITGATAASPRYDTRVKMMWDDEYLYIGAELQEPHVWAYNNIKNSVIFYENDFEVFIDPDGDQLNYYELEINALGTIWELSLDKPYNQGGSPRNPDNIPGLKSAVWINGTLNDASGKYFLTQIWMLGGMLK